MASRLRLELVPGVVERLRAIADENRSRILMRLGKGLRQSDHVVDRPHGGSDKLLPDIHYMASAVYFHE